MRRIRDKRSRYRGRFSGKTDQLGRDISKPGWYKRRPTGQQCDCDVENFDVDRTKQKYGHSDSIVRYMLLICPECGDEFAWSEYVVEG